MEEKLIEAVRGRTVIYDTSHADYLRTKLKLLIWEEIAQEIGMKSGSEAKTLWEKLRHSLRDALRRQKKYMRSGAAGTTSKPWKFQKQMGFLQPYMTNRTRETNLNHESDEDSSTQNQELQYENNSENNHEENNAVEPENEEREDECGTGPTSRRQTPETPPDLPGSSTEMTPTPRKKIRKTDSSDKMRTILLKSIENREKRAAERAAERAGLLKRIQPQNDPLYHFFMSMYETTKKMPPPSQHVVRNQIYKAVTDVEATLLNVPQTNISNPSQFIIYHDQQQYDRYCPSQRFTSTPLSSYSDSQALQIEATIQNDDSFISFQ